HRPQGDRSGARGARCANLRHHRPSHEGLAAGFRRCARFEKPPAVGEPRGVLRAIVAAEVSSGAKGRRYMSAKIEYTDEPLGQVQVVAALLPSPAELATASPRCFTRDYELGRSTTVRELERDVLGSDYGATSWTTRDEARTVAELLGLRPDMRLLDVGAGAGWPGL